MFKLPIRTWVRNAAAVFSAQHGAVAQQAREAGCSRETVYVHARKVEQHLDAALNNDAAWAELHAENLRLQHEVNALRRDAELATAGIARESLFPQGACTETVCGEHREWCLHTVCTDLALGEIVASWHRLSPSVRETILRLAREVDGVWR